MNSAPAAIAVVGPTAVGKSRLADALAQALESCVISADSMQIYKGMDIGTSKLPAELRSVPYYCIDILDPGQPYSAALFQTESRKIINDYKALNKTSVLCGGTGLYLRAALDDFHFPAGDQENNPVRLKYTQMLEEIGAQALHDFLHSKDPDSAELIHPNNSRRVIRALEMLDEGQSYAEQNKGFSQFTSYYQHCSIGLTCQRPLLYKTIDARVDEMISQGLIDEVIALRQQGYEEGLTAPQAIGYKEIIQFLDGHISLTEAVDSIKQATRRYAKRQMTWFNKDARIQWISANEGDSFKSLDQLMLEVHDILKEQGLVL